MLQKNNEIQIKNILLFFFLLLPFSYFFFNKEIDIWHAQGYFLQLGILLAFSCYLFNKSRPFGSLFLWVGLLTLFNFVNLHAKTKEYALGLFMPYFNFICIAILFILITKYFTKDTYRIFFKSLTVILTVVLIYSTLQKLNLDQFFKSESDYGSGNVGDEVQGVIGNPMHLSHYLALSIPVFFITPYGKIMAFFTLMVIGFTSSLSGLLIAILLLIIMQYFLKIYSMREISLFLLLGFTFLVYKYSSLHTFLTDAGRFSIWKLYLPIFKERAITGWGLGIVNNLSRKPEFTPWRHLHCEYYQYAVELGLIGLGLIIWGIVDYFKRFKKDTLSVIINCSFLGFCLTSFFGYPSHLWLTSSMGILAYSYNYLEV